MDAAYAKKLGVDIDNLLVSQPDYGEQALEIAELLVRSNAVDVLVVDSVAALVPKAELDGDMAGGFAPRPASAPDVASIAQTCRHCSQIENLPDFHQSDSRAKIGVMFGNPETTTGGRALKFLLLRAR